MFYQFQQFTTLAIHSFKTTIIWAHVHSHSEGKACFLFLFNHLGGIVARLSDFTHQKQVETNKSNNSCLVLINGFPQLLVLNTPPPSKKKKRAKWFSIFVPCSPKFKGSFVGPLVHCSWILRRDFPKYPNQPGEKGWLWSMKWESMGNVHVFIQICLVISFCKEEPKMNGNIMKIPHLFFLLQNHDIKRLVYIVNITSNYPWAYPHIFAIPPFTTHPGNDFADEKTHGGRARVSANVWAEGCGPSARHVGPGELWGWGSLRKKTSLNHRCILFAYMDLHTLAWEHHGYSGYSNVGGRVQWLHNITGGLKLKNSRIRPSDPETDPFWHLDTKAKDIRCSGELRQDDFSPAARDDTFVARYPLTRKSPKNQSFGPLNPLCSNQTLLQVVLGTLQKTF